MCNKWSEIQLLLFNWFLFSNSINDHVEQHLGTRTPYRFVSNLDDKPIFYDGCTPKKIWMLIRHGTRYPSISDIEGMQKVLLPIKEAVIKNHKHGNGELNKTQIDVLKHWSPNVSIGDSKILVLEGRDEMVLLAERMQHRFPTLLPNSYNKDDVLFRYTSRERTQQSAKFFTIGLFDIVDASKVHYPPTNKHDSVLRFYKYCHKWRKEIKKNVTAQEEHRLYGISSEMNQTLDSVAKRLGIKELSLDEANLIYKICGFETAWNKNKKSPWCFALDVQDAKVFEYYHDLKHYWLDSYGRELNYKQGCVLMNDMITFMGNAESKKASFLFAHSGSILKTLAHIGLKKPLDHLTHKYRDEEREFKTTEIDAFASNIAFVLFDCMDGEYLLTLVQERIENLNGCQSELCSMKDVKNVFDSSIKKCEFDVMCSLDKEQ